MIQELARLVDAAECEMRQKHCDQVLGLQSVVESMSALWTFIRVQSTAWLQDTIATQAGLSVFPDAKTREEQIVLQMKDYVRIYGGLPTGKQSALNRRWRRYQNELVNALPTTIIMQRRCLWETIPGWSWNCRVLEPYTPSDVVGSDTFGQHWTVHPCVSPPIVCELCGQGFLHVGALKNHCEQKHANYAEYAKRMLFRQEETGPREISHQEKRNLIQSFAQFQCCSIVSAGCNDWVSHQPEQLVPRRQEACVVCARLDWIEHRYLVDLWAYPTTEHDDASAEEHGLFENHDSGSDSDSESNDEFSARSVAAVQNPQAVNRLLTVHRYVALFPYIPIEELIGSAVRHPKNSDWLWLLHSRRVKLETHEELVPQWEGYKLAGVGNPVQPVWMCLDCKTDLCRKRPRMPKFALVNHNWLGRLPSLFQNLTQSMHWMLTLARPCWHKLILGSGRPAERHLGVTGNSILLAQPVTGHTVEELPPPTSSLSENVLVVFTSSIDNLNRATWAHVDRNRYLDCARLGGANQNRFV